MTDLPTAAGDVHPDQRHLPRFRVLLVGALLVLGALWLAPIVVSFLTTIDLEGLDHPYATIFVSVVLDAFIPIFPSESLLTAGSSLAAQDGSQLVLWKLMAAGALGAIVGDSILYWLSRTVLRRTMAGRVEAAQRNPKIARSMEVVSRSAGILIVFGRFVPGLRFMMGATMGLTEYPYRRYLLWDAIGATFWAVFNCGFAYAIASAMDDKPLLSMAVSVIVTTALLALLYQPLKRSWEASGQEQSPAADLAV